MIKRRKSIGGSLLTAASVAGSTLVMSSCVGKEVVSGNLMPPPEIELCIEVTPEDAVVTVQHSWGQADIPDGSCERVGEGSMEISATADGYEEHTEVIDIFEDTTHEIEMVPLVEDGDGQEEDQ